MPDVEDDRSLAGITKLLAASVREAGELALRKFRTPFKTWIKDQSSPVTEVDIAIDELLHDRLAAPGHGYGWLSEETADDPARLQARRVWIVDPLDGTRGFIAGMPDWSIVAALVEDGRPIAAALYAPVDDQMFLASAGHGASVNGEPIAASAGETLAGTRIAGPRSRLEALVALAPRIEVMPRLASLALRLARVAEGRFDVAFAGPRSRDWDLAAADLLVHEAGGAMTGIDGNNLVYNRPEPVHGALMAAGRARHGALLELMRRQPAKFA